MTPRLGILLALAVVVAVLAAKRFVSPPPTARTGPEIEEPNPEPPRLPGLLWQRDLPGVSPAEEPELDVRVEVNTTSGKNRLDYYISEAHGYYVEYFVLEFWWKDFPEMRPADSPLRVTHHANVFLEANKTLKRCLEIVPAELARVGGDIGVTSNWGARIVKYQRARETNPDPLPDVADMAHCD